MLSQTKFLSLLFNMYFYTPLIFQKRHKDFAEKHRLKCKQNINN